MRPVTLFSEKFGNYLGANITPADKGIVTQKGYSAIKGLSNWMEERDSKSDAVEAGDNMSQGTSGLNMGISAGCPERVIFV